MPSLSKTYKYIFNSFLRSQNHEEFDLQIKIFNLKKNNEKIEKENKKLKKEIKKLKTENESLISSNSWKYTKPLRGVSKLFKK